MCPSSQANPAGSTPLDTALEWGVGARPVFEANDRRDGFRDLFGWGHLLPARQLAEMKRTVAVSVEVQQLWPGGRYRLGLAERPLSCGGTYWGHEGGDGGYITLNGVTDDGGRSAVVSMSEARGDTPQHILAQENAAGALIDHALCAGNPARGSPQHHHVIRTGQVRAGVCVLCTTKRG
ncbi:hypothetical protein ACFVH0_27345 [Streptomyces sp. NPDC127117]|uniref:hypothetical protein n=1 Tax=Streptomyces sp. NPDC127117 TaxID=3345368 RepID=UPI00362F5640